MYLEALGEYWDLILKMLNEVVWNIRWDKKQLINSRALS